MTAATERRMDIRIARWLLAAALAIGFLTPVLPDTVTGSPRSIAIAIALGLNGMATAILLWRGDLGGKDGAHPP